MKVEIDLDKVFNEAMEHMINPDDLRWSIGMALQELYFDDWMKALQTKMVDAYARGVTA
jgi:hypothetical protein